jgi:hypothetical protein
MFNRIESFNCSYFTARYSPLEKTLHKTSNGELSITCLMDCPKCHTNARDQWLAARASEVLPVPYFHVVFTVPQELAAIGLQNKGFFYELLLRISADTMLEVATNPDHLGAQIGFLSMLHTWGQNLLHHPHVHCVVPAGGLSEDHWQWKRTSLPRFFLNVDVLSRVFRGKFKHALTEAFQRHQISFHGQRSHLADPKHFARLIQSLYRQRWIVYAKAPFGGPEHVLHTWRATPIALPLAIVGS